MFLPLGLSRGGGLGFLSPGAPGGMPVLPPRLWGCGGRVFASRGIQTRGALAHLRGQGKGSLIFPSDPGHPFASLSSLLHVPGKGVTFPIRATPGVQWGTPPTPHSHALWELFGGSGTTRPLRRGGVCLRASLTLGDLVPEWLIFI